MTTERDTPQDGLGAFFAAAQDRPSPSEDLVARILADAAEVQAVPASTQAPQEAPGFWQMIGGWVAVSGLAAACATGIAIGVTLPTAVGAGIDGTLTNLLEGQQTLGFAGFDAVSFAGAETGE